MVRLFEYEGKRILREAGIPVPDGDLATTPEKATEIAQKIGTPVVVKAQVLTTGRFRAGGIRFSENPEETWQNAKDWAQRGDKQYNYEKRQWEVLPGVRPEPVVIDNTPKRGYKLVGAESRGEGGRAWKVVSPEGHLVDLREDVFMPILLTRGLNKQGIINARLQWCVNGSQIRLEEVGSDNYKHYLSYAFFTYEKSVASLGSLSHFFFGNFPP